MCHTVATWDPHNTEELINRFELLFITQITNVTAKTTNLKTKMNM